MTVKKRISLLIIGAGLITSLLFSVVVFIELMVQSYDVLDRAIKDEAYSMTRMFVKQHNKLNIETFDSDFIPGYLYWLKITEQGSNKILFQSRMAKLIKLHSIGLGTRAVETVKVSRKIFKLHQDKSQKVSFRVRTFSIDEGGKTFIVQIARSIRTLSRETRELFGGLVLGFFLSGIVLFLISRFIAGKILKPIGEMKELTQNISEKNLNKRIPTGSEKDEFNELARTINKMLDRLQGSFIKQRNFLFDTSHELKTPLTTMRLTIDEICSVDTEKLPTSTTETLFMLNNQVLRMERLVKDLLNLSALETLTGIDPKPIDLAELLSSLAHDYHVIADAQNIRIDIQLPDTQIIHGDSEKLTRAFSNLLDNAIKYNVDNGRVEVTTIQSGSQSKNDLTIKIGNTGQGVTELEINKVFDQFYRAEKSRSIQHGGYGLGLAIVKRIIDLHNGSIQFKSKPGIWTEVIITFPGHLQNITS